MSWDSAEEAMQRLKNSPRPYQDNYLGFYSSWLGGFFREPWSMLIPVDDHGFHRGDGVFEAVRIHGHAYFDLDAHLKRLQASAAAIGIQPAQSPDEIRRICLELARRCDCDTGVLRLYLSRGPGSFSPNPADSVGPQLYAAITKLKGLPEELYQRGAKVMIGTVAAKDGFWSQIKSNNYLQNVLMKKESVERGYDFSLSVDGQGRVCEGATENFALLTSARELLVPDFNYTLRGTTVSVVMALAQDMVNEGAIQSVRCADLRRVDLDSALEAAMIGTTMGVLPIGILADRVLAKGTVFPELRTRLAREMSSNPKLRQIF